MQVVHVVYIRFPLLIFSVTNFEIIDVYFQQSVPDKIVLSAAHLFLSITSTVRPSFLITLPCIQRLFNDVSDGSLSGQQTEVSVKRFISKVINKQ